MISMSSWGNFDWLIDSSNDSVKFSEVTSQILYGEKFKILIKKKNWVKIKTSFDNYVGYIENKNYVNNLKPTHKIFALKARIYNGRIDKKNFLPFASKISMIRENKNFIEKLGIKTILTG